MEIKGEESKEIPFFFCLIPDKLEIKENDSDFYVWFEVAKENVVQTTMSIGASEMVAQWYT